MVQNTPVYTTVIVIVACAVILFLVIFFYLLIIQLHHRRVIHQKEMFDLKSQYERTILESQLEIQEQTFRNISQEIHDNIGQALSLAKLNLNTIPQNGASDKIALTEELLGKAINDLRDLSKSLHPEKITDIGLINAIRHELQLVQKAAKLSTEMIIEEKEANLSNEKSIIIFRMIQEILHNIIKHAKAKNVTLIIRTGENKTIIEVNDNGTGFNPANLKSTETGIGLKSIQQRCALINASCNIRSTPGVGTSVMDGFATAERIKNNAPEIKVLVLSMMDDDNAIIKMLQYGARGYILKDSKPDVLKTALREVIEKGFFFNDLVSGKLIHLINKGEEQRTQSVNLNDKETEFLKWCCTEKSYKEIADVMNISTRAVETLRSNLFEKLETLSRVGLVMYAIRNGIVKV